MKHQNDPTFGKPMMYLPPEIVPATDPEIACEHCDFYSFKVVFGEDEPTCGKCFRHEPQARWTEWTRSDFTCAMWRKAVIYGPDGLPVENT